ncbi:MAG: protein-glutamate O-methyltransferase CheR [Pirellulales bacterium]
MTLSTLAAQPDLSPQQMRRFSELVYAKIGVTISPQKVTLLSNRLRRRLRASRIESYDAYFEHLRTTSTDTPEWEAFLQEVTTHETYLFRDEAHWEWIRNVLVPDLMQQARIGKRKPTFRAWSAACSTGDEATSLACCLADRLQPLNDWKIEIVGTDVGSGAVETARRGEFGERAMRLVPESMRRRFFEFDAQRKCWSSKDVLRRMLTFRTHNLLTPLKEQPFDLVLLKNVLIYFDAASKKQVIGELRRTVRPGGYLITGAAEGVADLIRDLDSTNGWLHRFPQASLAKSGAKA